MATPITSILLLLLYNILIYLVLPSCSHLVDRTGELNLSSFEKENKRRSKMNIKELWTYLLRPRAKKIARRQHRKGQNEFLLKKGSLVEIYRGLERLDNVVSFRHMNRNGKWTYYKPIRRFLSDDTFVRIVCFEHSPNRKILLTPVHIQPFVFREKIRGEYYGYPVTDIRLKII